jgi:hypothetical protein
MPAPTQPDSRFQAAQRALPWALGILAFFMRWSLSRRQGWYPDEGAFTELALSLWRSGMASVGPVKQTAFLPMGCSWLAPALAAPWAGLSQSPLLGVRLWVALCCGVSAASLTLLLQRFAGLAAALAAGLSFAVWPLAVHLGAWAVYHQLAAALLLLCAWQAALFQEAPTQRRWLGLCAATGLAAAAAYWSFWLLLLPAALALPQQRRRWLLGGLPLLALPLLLAIAIGYFVDPASFAIDFKGLDSLSHAGLPGLQGLLDPLYSFGKAAKAFPPLALGLVGLLGLLAQEVRARRLTPLGVSALALFLGCMDIFRQRQNLEGFAYPLVLALPAFCFGLGLVAGFLGRAWQAKQPRWILAAAAFAGVFYPPEPLIYMQQLCAPPVEAQDLLAKAAQDLKPGDLVLGQAPFNWGFPRGVLACQFDDVAAVNGEALSFLPMGLPPSRFKYRPALEDARWIVLGPYSYGFTFGQLPCLMLGLKAEQLGFHKIWSNAVYTIYANPKADRLRPAYAERMLAYYNLYDTAALTAIRRKDWPTAYFALQQVLPYQQGDVAGRKAALADVEKQMRGGR